MGWRSVKYNRLSLDFAAFGRLLGSGEFNVEKHLSLAPSRQSL